MKNSFYVIGVRRNNCRAKLVSGVSEIYAQTFANEWAINHPGRYKYFLIRNAETNYTYLYNRVTNHVNETITLKPRRNAKYFVKHIDTPQFTAYKDENGYTIRYWNRPYKHPWNTRGLFETHELMQKLEGV